MHHFLDAFSFAWIELHMLAPSNILLSYDLLLEIESFWVDHKVHGINIQD